MPLERMKRIVREDFDAQIGIWGSVERAPGHEGEVYDLVIKCVDFSAPGGPKTIYEPQRPHQVGQRNPAPLRQGDARRTVRPRARAAPPVARSRGRGELEEEPEPRRRRRFPAGAGGVPRGLGTGGRAAPRAAGRPGPLGRRGRQAVEQGDPLHASTRTSATTKGVMYYSKPFPRRGGREVSLPVPLAVQRPGGQGLHQVLRRDRHRPIGGSRASRRQAAPRGLSQPAEPQRARQRLEHADRGLHAAAHEVHAPLGPRDALRLPRRGASSSSTTSS